MTDRKFLDSFIAGKFYQIRPSLTRRRRSNIFLLSIIEKTAFMTIIGEGPTTSASVPHDRYKIKATLADIKGPAGGFDGPFSFCGLPPEDRLAAADKYGHVVHLITPEDQSMSELVRKEMEYLNTHGVQNRLRTRPDGTQEFIEHQLTLSDLREAGYYLALTWNHPTKTSAVEQIKKSVSDARSGMTQQQAEQHDREELEWFKAEWEKTIAENPGKTRIIWGLDGDYLFVKD